MTPQVVAVAQSLMKDILTASLGRNGPLGGVKFDLDDDKFDAQPAVGLLPRILVTPFDMLLAMCTSGLSESNKDRMVGLMADACCERLEQYVTTSTFRFAGALKFEECVRAICATFTRFSTVPIRGKFSRLREVMLVSSATTFLYLHVTPLAIYLTISSSLIQCVTTGVDQRRVFPRSVARRQLLASDGQ